MISSTLFQHIYHNNRLLEWNSWQNHVKLSQFILMSKLNLLKFPQSVPVPETQLTRWVTFTHILQDSPPTQKALIQSLYLYWEGVCYDAVHCVFCEGVEMFVWASHELGLKSVAAPTVVLKHEEIQLHGKIWKKRAKVWGEPFHCFSVGGVEANTFPF